MEKNIAFEKVHRLLNCSNLADIEDNLIDIRLFGSVLKRPYSECNDIDLLFIVKDGDVDTIDLKLANGINIASQELNTRKGKVYAKSSKTFIITLLFSR